MTAPFSTPHETAPPRGDWPRGDAPGPWNEPKGWRGTGVPRAWQDKGHPLAELAELRVDRPDLTQTYAALLIGMFQSRQPMRCPDRRHFLAVLVALGLVGCGGGDGGAGDSASAGPLTVNERNGTVDGVGIGDDADTIEGVFGEAPPYKANIPITPVDVDDPLSLTGSRSARACRGLGKHNALRYEGVSFFLVGNEACSVTVTGERASLRRGLRPGDPIERAEELYPKLDCGQTDVGADRPVYEQACAGAIGGDVSIWIGGDPINNISFATVPRRRSG